MFSTCANVDSMSTMIQIRNVPDSLHRRLKSRAALAGMSLSDFLLKQIEDIAQRATVEELRARLARRTPVQLSIDSTEIIRQERERR